MYELPPIVLYKGQFKKNKYDGRGILRDKDAPFFEKYSGEFRDGLYDGEGEEFYSFLKGGGTRFKGIYVKGQPVQGNMLRMDGSLKRKFDTLEDSVSLFLNNEPFESQVHLEEES